MDMIDILIASKFTQSSMEKKAAGPADALVTLAELGIVTPAQQDGVLYTDNDGKIFVL